MMSNLKEEEFEKELDYYKKRVSQLEEDKPGIMDNVSQANISYELRFCKKEIERLMSEIEKFKKVHRK